MTEKQLCRDCKHLEHDGVAGIWCGVHGNNMNYNCPKFEYNWGILTKEEAINHLNRLYYENKQLKKQLEYSREEADDYCEELMGKDEFVRLYKRQRDDALKENEELKRKVKHFKELWAETSMENAELREKIDKSNKRFVKKLNTIQKQWG